MSENRDAYVSRLKAKLDEWNADIDKLETRARRRQAAMRTTYRRHMDDLKAKRKTVREKLDTLQNAGGEVWGDLRHGLENAAGALGEAIKSARDRLKQDDGPHDTV